MTPEAAKRLLDAQKGDEQFLQWKPQGKPTHGWLPAPHTKFCQIQTGGFRFPDLRDHKGKMVKPCPRIIFPGTKEAKTGQNL
jgi:hypothetical protein